MQALSGTGIRACRLSIFSIMCCRPSITGGEDHKVETEPLKLLGQWKNNSFVDASIRMSAQTHRVNVRDGHLEAVSGKADSEGFARRGRSGDPGLSISDRRTGVADRPKPAILVETDIQRPQPRLDRDRGNGMAVVVGPLQPCAVLDYKFRVCSHNTIRGAAGAAILNAELLYKKGIIG